MTLPEAIAHLKATYPRQDFPDTAVRAYIQHLADLNEQAVSDAITRLIHTTPFLPSIAEIRRDVAEHELALPSAAEAWMIAERGSLRDAPVEVREAAESCGGRWSIIHAENPETVRAQFVRDYESRRERALLRAQGALQTEPVSLPVRKVAQLPESTRIAPRPVVMRHMRRLGGLPLATPTDEEKHDAIRVLSDETNAEEWPWLYQEAEKVFAEASV